ncbi:shikimate kinase AroK [Gammaproteobacteria bacterium]|jgi:shikimate kinase|nr:shikimate kinase AroK [Gammaproteobacteria bacterium]MDB9947594.1 shikimate kinase AroK [Gammaproteobacteria bacterium]|tara:strand:- start:363 stop:872 length:510 start_codon:yes stop_codon:yes gene_type:complete
MNIFIVGPMGSGKTTVGKIVANELFLDFYDTDATIEDKTGVTIDWIFDIEGEQGFRKRETSVLKGLVASNSIVLATGGGIVIESENRELLSSRGTVFYLHTPLETQVNRTSKDKDRPLLKDKDPEKVLADLQKSRQGFYEEVSDHIINTENKSGSEVANEIVKLVKNYG